MGIVGNEIADQLARVGSSHPLIGPEPALGVSAKVARRVMRSVDRGRLRAFFKKAVKAAGELLRLSQTLAKDDDGTANRALQCRRAIV